ncbi:MAG: hypothetical protein MJZ42_04850 [Bacteroidales bacterium]|nr:hypothetical protein [Bacteroidales bacterium]
MNIKIIFILFGNLAHFCSAIWRIFIRQFGIFSFGNLAHFCSVIWRIFIRQFGVFSFGNLAHFFSLLEGLQASTISSPLRYPKSMDFLHVLLAERSIEKKGQIGHLSALGKSENRCDKPCGRKPALGNLGKFPATGVEDIAF